MLTLALAAFALDPAWVTVAAMVGLAGLSAVSIWVGRITKGQSAADAATLAAGQAAATAQDAHKRLDDLNQQFGNFKEHVAREYVPNAAVTQMEARMADEFKRVRDTLQQLFVPANKG